MEKTGSRYNMVDDGRESSQGRLLGDCFIKWDEWCQQTLSKKKKKGRKRYLGVQGDHEYFLYILNEQIQTLHRQLNVQNQIRGLKYTRIQTSWSQ